MPKEYQQLLKPLYDECKMVMFREIFKNVQNLFRDPRNEDTDSINEEDKIQSDFFAGDNSIMYQVGTISSLATLRHAYDYLNGRNDRDEDHYKMATIHMDFILTSIEKFNIFSSLTDFFSKYRIFPFIGIAAGFSLDHDSLLRAHLNQ